MLNQTCARSSVHLIYFLLQKRVQEQIGHSSNVPRIEVKGEISVAKLE